MIVSFWFGFALGTAWGLYTGFIGGMIVEMWRHKLPSRFAAWVERKIS